MIFEIELSSNEHRLLVNAMEKAIAALMASKYLSEDDGYKRMVQANIDEHQHALTEIMQAEAV